MKVESFNISDTFELGKQIGKQAKAGDVYALTGDLGVGKTVFAKGLAEGLGIEEPITSPTFTILQIYNSGRLPLYHFDVYRIVDIDEMNEIGYEDCFYGEGVSLIEWADVINGLLPRHTKKIHIEKNIQKGYEYRQIIIERGDNIEDSII